MSHITATVRRFSGEFSADATVSNARHTWTERAGLLLHLVGADGIVGQGEASPLPHFSPDTLDDCEWAIRRILPEHLLEAGACETPTAIFDWVSQQIPEALPAARFALETALLDLLAQRQSQPLHRLFRATPPERIPLSALLPTLPTPEALSIAISHFDRGVRTFKIKVGAARRFEAEQQLLAELRAHFGNTVQLRLDANQSFDADSVAERLTALSVFEPEYVEEPCALEALLDLGELPVRIACDESLQRMSPRSVSWLSEHPGSVLVLKPTVLGGFAACLKWATWAAQNRLALVISHAFEGPIALLASAQLALSLEVEQKAAGLMPHAGLEIWPQLELPGFEPNSIRGVAHSGLGFTPRHGVGKLSV